MTEIILVRHGETELNTAGVFRGRADVALNERGRPAGLGDAVRLLPELDEEFEVALDLPLARACRRRAHDQATPRRPDLARDRLEPVALRRLLYLPGDTHRAREGYQHEEAPGQRYLGRHPRALRADRLLRHLSENLLALLEQILDRDVWRAHPLALLHLERIVAREVPELRGNVSHVGDVQERALLHPDINERGLHTRQDRAHDTFVEVADDPPALPALHHDLHKLVVLEDGYPRLAGRHVDNDFLMHITPLYGGPHPTAGGPDARNL
ncbi:MAG: histidine phosphatase family protein [Candidatus Eisenbacteria bacterium]|nr:histidine phosphatase family protein [Candidatus Eisenbacteria bacterium]